MSKLKIFSRIGTSFANTFERKALSAAVTSLNGKNFCFSRSFSSEVSDSLTPPNDQIPATILPREAEREKLTKFGEYVKECLPLYVQQVQLTYGNELEILIDPGSVVQTLTFLKSNFLCQFSLLSDITCVDVPTRPCRFEIVYNLLSIHYNQRLRVKTYTDEFTSINSICETHTSANWYEREVSR